MTDSVSASGINQGELDAEVRPQDDLFRHVNGKWIARTEIPADKARWGSFTLLAEEAEKAVRDIILESQSAEPGTQERKVGDLFASFLDEERIEALGATPLTADLAAVDAVTSISELLSTLGRLERAGVAGAFQLYVDNDPGDPERYLVFVQQGGIGLPDESYYREDKFAGIRDSYLVFLERMFTLAGVSDAAARAKRVFDLETEIAGHHWDKVESRDSEKSYNLRTWGQMSALAAGADLDLWLDALDAPERSFDEVVVRQPSFVVGLAATLTDDRLDAWTDWLRWQVIRSSSSYLSGDFVEANFDFYGRTLSGTPQLRERWKRGVSLVEGALGEAVGRIYVDRHFQPTAKESMDVLVGYLVAAYQESIETLDWMTEETRGRALDKLSKFTPKIGYPVKWRDYSTLEIVADDLLANVQATNDFEFSRELGKIGKKLDRDEWFMTPQTINAYYNPGFNEIVFPAAILQFPFFDESRDSAANYGAIGAVIGHEIGHGFDDQGRLYDATGKLRDWWTADSAKAYGVHTAALAKQYDSYEPIPGVHIKGELTLGENIGDLGGLEVAYEAYHRYVAKHGEPAVIGGLTGDQRFFIAYAYSWQNKQREGVTRAQLLTNPHSPAKYRVNGVVRNMDEWYRAFNVKPGDAMYLPPEQRVHIW